LLSRHRRGTGERGQALLELALVAPIMILLLASLVQFGIIFERQIGIENAVREAARRGATLTTKNDTGIAQTNANWTLTQLNTLLANTQTHDASLDRDLEVCIYTPTGSNATDPAGNHQVWIKVSAGYAHPLFLPIIDLILDGIDGDPSDRRLRVDTSATFHVEQGETGDFNLGSGVAARSSGDVTPC
jgi:hypothetical protein